MLYVIIASGTNICIYIVLGITEKFMLLNFHVEPYSGRLYYSV